jgi:hypothetical protein
MLLIRLEIVVSLVISVFLISYHSHFLIHISLSPSHLLCTHVSYLSLFFIHWIKIYATLNR